MLKVLLVLAAFSIAMSAQEPQPELAIRIVSPEPDAYVSGVTLLKAAVVPAVKALEVNQLLFYADGKQVCNVLDPIAAECTWDAGEQLRPHVIRVVANLKNGGRLVASARTRGLEQVEKVVV